MLDNVITYRLYLCCHSKFEEVTLNTANWEVVFYETTDGKPVVEEEIRAFGLKPYARVLQTLGLIEQYGIDLRGDYLEHVSSKIWELRISRYRILYFTFTGRKFVLLRAFIKKSRKTPKKDIQLAENRLEDFVIQLGLSSDSGSG